MTDKPQHSPTPWKVHEKSDYYDHIMSEKYPTLRKMEDSLVATVFRKDADAKHIVHCVNNHDALVEALETADALVKEIEANFSEADFEIHYTGIADKHAEAYNSIYTAQQALANVKEK